MMDQLYNTDGRMLCARAEPYTNSATSSTDQLNQGRPPTMSERGVSSAVESFRYATMQFYFYLRNLKNFQCLIVW